MDSNSEKAMALLQSLMQAGIQGAQGRIQLELMGVSIDVVDKSATGNLLQEWFGNWMEQHGVYFRVQPNTQTFPDFFLSERDDIDLLELKSFDYQQAPNFDIANFDTYRRSIATHAYRLDADYLLFGYELGVQGLVIKDVWLKKVWEICCPADERPLRLQVKQNVIHNIRPYNFKNMSTGYQPFASRLAFVKAIRETIRLYKPEEDADEWFTQVADAYRSSTNRAL